MTEIEADEVGASLKWAVAKVERASQRGNGDRNQGRERQVERSGDFNDPAPFRAVVPPAPLARLGALEEKRSVEMLDGVLCGARGLLDRTTGGSR